MNDYVPKNGEGNYLYVLTKYSWGKSWDRLVWAKNLKAAKVEYGHTRERYTTCRLRRATVDDLSNESAAVASTLRGDSQ